MERCLKKSVCRREFLKIATVFSLKIATLVSLSGFLVRCASKSPASLSEGIKEAKYYSRLGGNEVRCGLCFRGCRITDGQRGYCGARMNREGRLYSLVYNQPAGIQVDPVEKEPLLHFLPGSRTLCFGTAGCNFKCSFCQNWQLSTKTPEELAGRAIVLSPEQAVNKANELGCKSISFTYNEPTVFYEWVYDVAKLGEEKGLRTYFHTNGAMNPEPLKALLKHMDAVAVDLKAFTASFYRETSLSQLEPVLSTLKTIREAGVWLEITNLIIPTMNDDLNKIREMCIWIRDNLGKDVPVHFSRFFPAYKLMQLPPTPVETLEAARAIALEVGLEYGSIGNVPGHDANSTFCSGCGKILIKRVHFTVLENHVRDGRCEYCGRKIPGVWC